jgi:hypothetical protein
VLSLVNMRYPVDKKLQRRQEMNQRVNGVLPNHGEFPPLSNAAYKHSIHGIKLSQRSTAEQNPVHIEVSLNLSDCDGEYFFLGSALNQELTKVSRTVHHVPPE